MFSVVYLGFDPFSVLYNDNYTAYMHGMYVKILVERVCWADILCLWYHFQTGVSSRFPFNNNIFILITSRHYFLFLTSTKAEFPYANNKFAKFDSVHASFKVFHGPFLTTRNHQMFATPTHTKSFTFPRCVSLSFVLWDI